MELNEAKKILEDIGTGSIASYAIRFAASFDNVIMVLSGMGNMDMTLTGQYTQHDYEIDCGMGSVRVGDMTYSGMSSGQNVDNNSDSEFDLDCGMGSMNIVFKE